jgi:hypothetical protein
LWNSTTYWEDFRDGEYETPPDHQGLAAIAALKFIEYDEIDEVINPQQILGV